MLVEDAWKRLRNIVLFAEAVEHEAAERKALSQDPEVTLELLLARSNLEFVKAIWTSLTEELWDGPSGVGADRSDLFGGAGEAGRLD